MKILCDSGVVVGRKEGKWMHYSISEDGLENVMKRGGINRKLEVL